MKWHFDLGNSNTGPVGFCAVVEAPNKTEALKILKAALPGEERVRPYAHQDKIVYIEAYFNDKHITEADIKEWE